MIEHIEYIFKIISEQKTPKYDTKQKFEKKN